MCACSVAQLCLTLCDPMGCSLPNSSILGFFRQEYWSGLPFPSPGDLPNPGIEPRSAMLGVDSLPTEPPGKPSKNTRVGNLSLLQRIFLTQESNQGLLHCRQMRYQLSYQEAQFWPSTGWQKLSSPMSLCAFPIIIPVRLCFFLWI